MPQVMKSHSTMALVALGLVTPLSLQASIVVSRTQLLMGNIPVVIQIRTSPFKKPQAFAAMTEAFKMGRLIEEKLSHYQPQSEVSLLNRMAGRHWVPIGGHLAYVLLLSERMSRISGGAFDITFASKDKGADYRDVLVDPGHSRAFLKDQGVRINVSSAAKGYLIDRMSEVLTQKGFDRHMVNAGGDLNARGTWTIGLRDPQGSPDRILYRLRIRNQAAASAGTYERGRHIVDPRFNKPVAADYGVTVLAPNAALANALATTAFVLGKEGTGLLLIYEPQAIFYFAGENGLESIGQQAVRYQR